MSFGFGVGDFLAVLKLANKIRKDFVGAPDQFKDISAEVRSLAIVLQDVDVIVSECELSDQQRSHLQELAHGCHNVLEKLDKTLDKYVKLDSDKGPLGTRVKRVWERLKWEPEDVRELRDRVTSNITLLGTFLEGISSQAALATRKGVERLNQHQDDQERFTFLNWLSPTDYVAQQQDFFSWRQPGTGQWLLDSAEYKAWLGTKGDTLFCPGIPGAGKTVLTALTIDDLTTRFDGVPDVGLAYVYCNFRRHDEQKALDLLAGLLKQLIPATSPLPDAIKVPWARRARPSFVEISQALESVVAAYSRAFIVVDALDECQESDNCRTRFLDAVFHLRDRSGANVFATSRFIPEIVERFRGSPSLEIRADPEDVERYLKAKMVQLRPFVQRNVKLQEEITTTISKAVDGMFLLAHIYIGSLDDKPTPKAVRNALAQFQRQPRGSNEETKVQILGRAYDQAMERVNGQKAGLREMAIQVLSWITCAERPLSITELQHALAVEADEPDLDEENLPEVGDMVSVCSGLVATDEESGTVRLIHYSTQEYFERTWETWFPNAHGDIAQTCAAYLCFDAFATGPSTTFEGYEERIQKYQLYEYAAEYWGDHARKASATGGSIYRLLSSPELASASFQALRFLAGDLHSIAFAERPTIKGINLAAWFGLEKATAHLLEDQKAICLHGTDVRADPWGHTPLAYAVRSGNGAVVEQLLKHGADPNVCCPQYLFSGRGMPSFTALKTAVESKNETVARLLLEYGADANWVWPEGGLWLVSLEDVLCGIDDTPLLRAISVGDETMVKLLVRHGADVNLPDGASGRTPLSRAVERGFEAIAEFLRKNGAKVEL